MPDFYFKFIKQKLILHSRMLNLLETPSGKEDWLDLHNDCLDLIAKCNMLTGHNLSMVDANGRKCIQCGYRPTDPNSTQASRKYNAIAGEDLISP